MKLTTLDTATEERCETLDEGFRRMAVGSSVRRLALKVGIRSRDALCLTGACR